MKGLLIVLAALISIAAWKKDMPTSPAATSGWSIRYSPGPTFRIQYPAQLAGQDGTSFDFPTKGSSVGYVVKTAPKLSLGQTISIKFSIEGDGTLVPTDSDPPARVRLYFQRAGDNGSGAGPYQHYRYWGHPDVVLGAARDYEVSVELVGRLRCLRKPASASLCRCGRQCGAHRFHLRRDVCWSRHLCAARHRLCALHAERVQCQIVALHATAVADFVASSFALQHAVDIRAEPKNKNWLPVAAGVLRDRQIQNNLLCESAPGPKAGILIKDVLRQRSVRALFAVQCGRGPRRRQRRSRWSERGHNPNDTSDRLQRGHVRPQSDPR
jgi:hypothetical protein